MGAPKLTKDILRRLLFYNPRTGDFKWKSRPGNNPWNARYAGKIAGFDWPVGKVVYRSIRIFDWPFLGHRLAFLYMTGAWPATGVDHRDMNGLNNRWANLREATKGQNAINAGPPSDNKTGFRGVCVCKRTGRFRANIGVQRRQISLGTFETAHEASAAYQAAASLFFGDYARQP